MRLRALVLVMMLGVVPAYAMQPQPPKDFVPVDPSSQDEQIPALPLIAAGYGFIWVGVLGYVWSLARRMQKVEAEITELESRKK